MIFVTSIDQYLIARFIQWNQYLLHFDSRLCLHREAFDEKESIRIMAALTSIVLLAPVIGPGGRWPDEFPALEVIVCDHRRHELAGTGVTDF